MAEKEEDITKYMPTVATGNIAGSGLGDEEDITKYMPSFGIEESESKNPITELAGGLYTGAKYGIPRQLAQASQFLGIGGEQEGDVAQRISEWGKKGMERTEAPGLFRETGEMIPQSVGIPMALMGSGKAISLIPHPAAKAVGAGLWGIGKASQVLVPAIFGLSQAQDTKEAAEERGVAPGIAPYLTGGVEFLGETLGNLALGNLFKFGKIGADFAKEGTERLMKGSLGQFVKTLVTNTMPTEIGTEMGQAGLQALIEKRAGIRPEADPWAEAIHVIGPTALMTALVGGGAATLQRYVAAKQVDTLANPVDPTSETAQEDMQRRLDIAGGVADVIGEEDPALKARWEAYAVSKIRENKPIDITAPIDSLSLEIDLNIDNLKKDLGEDVLDVKAGPQVPVNAAQQELPLEVLPAKTPAESLIEKGIAEGHLEKTPDGIMPKDPTGADILNEAKQLNLQGGDLNGQVQTKATETLKIAPLIPEAIVAKNPDGSYVIQSKELSRVASDRNNPNQKAAEAEIRRRILERGQTQGEQLVKVETPEGIVKMPVSQAKIYNEKVTAEKQAQATQLAEQKAAETAKIAQEKAEKIEAKRVADEQAANLKAQEKQQREAANAVLKAQKLADREAKKEENLEKKQIAEQNRAVAKAKREAKKAEKARQNALRKSEREAKKATANIKEPWQQTQEEFIASETEKDRNNEQRSSYIAEQVQAGVPEQEVAGALGEPVEAITRSYNEYFGGGEEEMADVEEVNYEQVHKAAVQKALAEGKKVPKNVLEKYPDLKPKTQAQINKEQKAKDQADRAEKRAADKAEKATKKKEADEKKAEESKAKEPVEEEASAEKVETPIEEKAEEKVEAVPEKVEEKIEKETKGKTEEKTEKKTEEAPEEKKEPKSLDEVEQETVHNKLTEDEKTTICDVYESDAYDKETKARFIDDFVKATNSGLETVHEKLRPIIERLGGKNIIEASAKEKTEYLTKEKELDLIKKAQAGNTKAQNKLVTSNMNFIRSYIYSLAKKNWLVGNVDEYINQAVIEYIGAIKRFRINSGYRLNTYAGFSIARAFHEAKEGNDITYNRTHKKIQYEEDIYDEVNKYKEELEEKANENIKPGQKRVFISHDDAFDQLAAKKRKQGTVLEPFKLFPLETVAGLDEYGNPINVEGVALGSSSFGKTEGVLEKRDTAIARERSIRGLIYSMFSTNTPAKAANARRNIFILTNKLLNDTPLTREELAEKFGETPAYIDKLEATIMKQFQKALEEKELAEDIIKGEATTEKIDTADETLKKELTPEEKNSQIVQGYYDRLEDLYEGTVTKTRERGLYSLPETIERFRRAVEAQKAAILEATAGRFNKDLYEILKRERVARGLIAQLESEKARLEVLKDQLESRVAVTDRKAGQPADNVIYSSMYKSTAIAENEEIIHREQAKGRGTKEKISETPEGKAELEGIENRLKDINESIDGITKTLTPTIEMNEKGFQDKWFAPANALAKVFGFELIPINDHTGTFNAFINRSSKQIFVNSETAFSYLQLVGHEISHVLSFGQTRKGYKTNEETQQIINKDSNAFKLYLKALRTATGRNVTEQWALNEYAADIQGGITSNYGINLLDGVTASTTPYLITRQRETVATRGTPAGPFKDPSTFIKEHNNKPLSFGKAIAELMNVTGKTFPFKNLIDIIDGRFVEVVYSDSTSTAAEWDRSTNKIFVNPDLLSKMSDPEMEIARAGLRSLFDRGTSKNSVRALSSFVNMISGLQQYLKNASPAAKGVFNYLLNRKSKKSDELAAYALTDTEFAKWLDSISDFSKPKTELTTTNFWHVMGRAMLNRIGAKATGRTKLDSVIDILAKNYPTYIDELNTTENIGESLAEARRYESPEEYVKAKSGYQQVGTRKVRETAFVEGGTKSGYTEFLFNVYKGPNGEEYLEPSGYVGRVEGGYLFRDSAGNEKKISAADMKRFKKPLIQTRHSMMNQIWKVAHGNYKAEERAAMVAELERARERSKAHYTETPEGEEKKPDYFWLFNKQSKNTFFSEETTDVSREKETNPIPVRDTLGVNSLDDSYKPLAELLIKSQSAQSKGLDNQIKSSGLKVKDTDTPVEPFAEKAKRIVQETLEKEYPGEENAALRAEITTEIHSAVAYEIQRRETSFVPPVRKLEEYNDFMEKEVVYAAEQTALEAKKLGLFDGVIVHRVEKKATSPETRKATPTGNIKVFRRTSTTSNQVGLISFIELEDYLMLTRTESKDPASLVDTYAKLFAEYDVDGISWPAGGQAEGLKKYEKKWAEIGATISSTKNGYYYKLTRDSLSKYLMESRLSKEEKARQKALVDNTMEFTGGILSHSQEEQIKASIIGARFDGDIDTAIDMIVGENDFVDITGLKNRANDIEASLSGGTYTGAAVDAVKGFVHQSSNISNMPEPIFKQMRNSFMKFGGIRHSRLRRWLSLPFTNSLKSVDWKRMWTVFVERIMNKEKDTYNILARGDFFLNREKYLKQQGYSRAQIKETTKRLERISFIMDENLRNDIFNAGEEIKAIDEQIEREPLLVDMDKLEARKIELQQRINTLTEKRMYSLEELKAGIKDWDGTIVKVNSEFEYKILQSIRHLMDDSLKYIINHMNNMLFMQYRNQSWYKALTEALGDELSQEKAIELAKQLKVSSQELKDIRVNFKGMMDRLEKGLSAKDAKDEADIKKQYDDIAVGLTKEMAGIKAFVSALSNTTEDIDGLIRTIFFAYQKTKPRLQQIRDLRNSWHEWPGYIPRRRPKGQIMMRVFEEYTDEAGAIKKKEVYAGMLESITQAGKEAEANKHYAEVVKRFGKGGKLAESFKFEYQAESQTPEGAFDGVKDFNVQMLIDNALDNMDKKGDYFDKNGKKVDVKMEIWDSAFEAIAGQFQQRGAASYGIRRKQELGEKAIKGYVEEGLDQILIDYVTSVTGFATKQVAAYKTTEILSSLEDKTRMNELREYANGQFRNDTELDKFSSKVRSLAFMWFLGLNLKSVAVNSTQPIIVGIPELDRYIREKGIGKKTTRTNTATGKTVITTGHHISGFLAQMKASRDVAKNGDIFFKSPDLWDDALKGISEIEKQFIEDATIAGSMAAQHIRMIKGLTSTYGKLWNKVFDIAALPFATIEKYNRTSSGLAMFRVAFEHYKSTGMTEKQAAEKATEDALHFINLVHYPIGKHNLPIPAQAGNEFGVAFKTAYTFRPFTHNFLLNQFNLLRSAVRLRNPQAEDGKTEAQVRAEATNDLITFVHTMALVGLFGGLLGLPFLKDIFDFFEKHFGYSPKQWARTTLRNVGGETLETFGMGGLPAVLGGNISGSLAIGVPFMNVDPSATVFGVYEGMGVKAKRAAEAALRGDPYRAVANMTPEFLRNPVVALTESDFGKEYLGSRGFATTPQGKVSYASTGKALSYTGGEAALKMIGFQPTRISKEREIEQTVKAQMLWADEKKKNIAETLNIDKLQNDPKAMQKMFKSVQEINKDIKERNIPVPLAKVSTILKNARDIKNLRKRRELKRRQELSE